MRENKQLMINFIAMVIAFGTNAVINFLLSKYIVTTVNEEAYGFIQFANTFINYFTVITVAINSMASRFISIEYYKGDKEASNNYYKSTLFANIVIILITAPLITLAILNIELLMQVSQELVVDVKFLLLFLTGNFYLGLITTNISVSYYIKNKLYIQSVINTLSYILKAILLLIGYKFLPPYIAIFGLATLIATSFVQLLTVYYKNKLIPEIALNKGKIQLNKLKTLIFSGIWNSITRIGNILSSGLDLLITNLFIGASEMGILAIVRTIPDLISSILANLTNIFMPNMIKLYAKGKKEEFISYIKKAMKIVGMFFNIPILCVIVLGDILFKLWFPTQDNTLLQILSIISIFPWIIIGPVSVMHNIFTVVNKIKMNSILVCITGLLNVLIVYILLKKTSLGLFAVTMISSIFSILRNLLYTLPYGAKAVGCKWYTFFPQIARSLLATSANVVIAYGIKRMMIPNSWFSLTLCGIVICMIGIIINFFILFSKEEKEYFLEKMCCKLKTIGKSKK